jgi:ComF family protein
MKPRGNYWNDFIALVFPQLCQACGNTLVINEHVICTECYYDLPYTNFHQQPDNVVARQFWGRLELSSVYVLFYFSKGGKVQAMMHQFKYRNSPKIGNKLGEIAGQKLTSSSNHQDIDFIIPVPLHPRKLRQRGYNQSQQFAEGLSTRLNIPVDTVNLIRLKHTDTQTKKARFSRYENMKDVFGIRDAEQLAGKHVLLVDDIITTGSTIEACGLELLKIPGVKVSVAAIAYAE